MEDDKQPPRKVDSGNNRAGDSKTNVRTTKQVKIMCELSELDQLRPENLSQIDFPSRATLKPAEYRTVSCAIIEPTP